MAWCLIVVSHIEDLEILLLAGRPWFLEELLLERVGRSSVSFSGWRGRVELGVARDRGREVHRT